VKPQDIVAKLTKQLADIQAKQTAALAASEADGVSADDRAKHIAEFDRLQAEKVGAKASLARAESMVREEEEAAKRIEAEQKRLATTPERPDLVMKPFVPPGLAVDPTGGRLAIPANVKRFGKLKAFSGPEAELRAYQFGLWVAATQYNHGPSRERLAAIGIRPQLATMTGTSNGAGGYFVPDEATTDILKLQEEYGVIRRNARMVPMSRETWSGPRWSTNMTAYWVSQGNAPTQSEPGWDRIELIAKDLAAFGKMTAQLNEDALIDLGDEWAMAAAVAFSYAEDNAAFNGDGTSTYGGINGLLTKIVDAVNSASLYTATGHTTLGALTMADFSAVVGKLPQYPGIAPKWFCHKEIWANSMLALQMAAGGLTPGDMQKGVPASFMGYPVEFVQVMPKASSVTTGVTGILFGDLTMSSSFGDRRQRTLRIGEINDDMIKQLLTLFAASRVDIVNHTITDPKNSSNAGPVLGLKLG
jgi:HK97 family phage major capsid protein